MSQDVQSRLADGKVAGLVEQHFGRSGELAALPGYCDQNFLLTTENGERFIVKIGGGSESMREIRHQNAALALLSVGGFPVPRVIENLEGDDLTRVADSGNSNLQLRLLTFLPGRFYADVPAAEQTPELWRSLGSLLGRLDVALLDVAPAQVSHYRLWDLAHGYVTCQDRKHPLDVEQTALVDHFLEYYRSRVLPLTGELPKSVIHNDANDHNLLVNETGEPREIIGLIDFGDIVYSHTINELAIAAAYALMNQDDPLEVLEHLVASYHAERKLSEAEVDALYGLIALRLCTTVCNAATEILEHPDNEYLLISVQPAWDLLGRLEKQSATAVADQLRQACNMPGISAL